MTKANLCDFSDLLSYATQIGYGWNEAHDIMDQDEIRPMYEIKTKTYYIDELQEYGYSQDTIKIIRGFMESESVDEITIA